MKATFLKIIFITFTLSLAGCASDQKVDELEKKLATTTARLDSLVAEHKTPWSPGPYWNYTWFDLGKDYHQTVNGRFSVTNMKTTLKENGFEVSGTIANLEELTKHNVKIRCAIKDSSVAGLLTFGYSEVSHLPSGLNTSFTVFVPTRQTKVSQVGVWVPEYRMEYLSP
jgi:hypothetical protein